MRVRVSVCEGMCARDNIRNLIRVAGQVKGMLALTELDLECNLIDDLSEAGIGLAPHRVVPIVCHAACLCIHHWCATQCTSRHARSQYISLALMAWSNVHTSGTLAKLRVLKLSYNQILSFPAEFARLTRCAVLPTLTPCAWGNCCN